MVSRKSDTPQGSGNKKLSSHDEDSEEEVPKERMTITTDYERRRTRVALRTGSPKPTAKLTLRAVKPKTQQTPPSTVSRGTSRTSISPSRAGLSSKSSPKSKPTTSSPERKPWGAPTIRAPAYHEQSISKRKRPVLEITASEETPPPKQKRRPTHRYSLADLLALRPPPTPRYSALQSYSEESELDLSHVYQSSAPQRRYAAISYSDDSQFDMGYGYHPSALPIQRRHTLSYSTESEVGNRGQPAPSRYNITPIRNQVHNSAPEYREQSPIEYSGSRLADAARRSFASSSQHSSSEEQHLLSFSNGIQAPIADSQTTRSSKGQKENQAASVDDLESRIRSALSHRGRRNFGVPKHLRSVRWDPSILTPAPGALDGVAETTGNSQPDLEKGKEKENPIEAPYVQENHQMDRKKKKEQFYEYMKSITELKKGDRKKLLQFLEALKCLDSDDSSDTDTEAQRVRRKSKKTTFSEAKSKLNPTANAFPAHPPAYLKATNETAPSAHVAPRDHHSSVEPVWVKTSDFFHVKSDEVGPKRSRTQESRAHALPDPAQPSQIPQVLPPTQFVPYTVPLIPLSPKTNQNAPSFATKPTMSRENTRVNPKLPIIDLTTGRIPDDNGPGREAQVVPWGNFILERFQKRYPGTGIQRAAAPAPIKNTHAATIQQRLEYLLMEQKENQARGEGLSERSGNTGQKLVKSVYQAERDALKRLKAEIRREDLVRKLREQDLAPNHSKIRVAVPRFERVSEASTCIDSTASVQEPDGE